jgi:hypothetical protein
MKIHCRLQLMMFIVHPVNSHRISSVPICTVHAESSIHTQISQFASKTVIYKINNVYISPTSCKIHRYPVSVSLEYHTWNTKITYNEEPTTYFR